MEIEQLPIVSETLPIKFPDRSVRSRFIDAAEGNGKSTIQQKDIPTSSTVDPQAKSCSSGAEMKFIRLHFSVFEHVLALSIVSSRLKEMSLDLMALAHFCRGEVIADVCHFMEDSKSPRGFTRVKTIQPISVR